MASEKRCDLHIHTALSPCGDKEMVPGRIVEQAKNRRLDVIGITDHNTAENVLSVRKVAEKEGLKVLSGIEITSSEEVHILAFFDDYAALKNMQDIIYDNLDGENDESAFGEQSIVDESDNIVGYNKKLLIGATKLKMEYIVSMVHSLKGLVFASHVDRGSFSIISQLGFIPENLSFDGLEISHKSSERDFLTNFPKCNRFPIVSFSDAHFREDIGKAATIFYINNINLNEIKEALKDGRYFITYT